MKMISFIRLFFTREILLTFRQGTELLQPLFFFSTVVTLFPLGITPNPQLLQQWGAGIIWIAILLASLLSLTHLFQSDYHDGSLDQWRLSSHPLSLMIFLKVLSQWLLTEGPLILISPLVGMMFHLTGKASLILFITLLLGTPSLMLIGAIVAALTMSVRQSGLLLCLVLLPLYIPILIFATTAVNAAQAGLAVNGQLAILGAFLILSLMAAPAVISFSLRIGMANQ